MNLPFELPPLREGEASPRWDGNAFYVGDRRRPFLEYTANREGWTDNLTKFHEETAGEDHFIDRASRHLAIRELRRRVTSATPVILEVGCSSGFLLRLLRQNFPSSLLIGSDVVSGPLYELAQQLPEPLLQFDIVKCPIPDNVVDAVVMLNVLEHVDDDEAALRQVYRILTPGGYLIIEVPAGPQLYDVYDKMLLHRRRYKLSQLTALAKKAGFDIVRKSHLGCFLYPGFWLVKQRNKRLFHLDPSAVEKVVGQNIRSTGGNPLLEPAMKFELWLGRYISYPFGIRCLLTCRKGENKK